MGSLMSPLLDGRFTLGHGQAPPLSRSAAGDVGRDGGGEAAGG